MKQNPYILEIKGNSLDDGPGIRTIVFFKGCPLDCSWCHNPESKSKRQELSFDKAVCIACNTCLETCEEGALDRNSAFFVNREACNLCFDCVETCPAEALAQVGKSIEIEEIISTLVKDIPFFKTSGGGLTLSGGEPLMHPEFSASLLRAAKNQSIHTLIETCGVFDFDNFVETVAPFCDQLYFDLKLFDNDAHKQHCGASNKQILKNLVRLSQLANDDKIDLLPRLPLIPGITDTEKNLTQFALLLKENRLSQIALLDYNPTWKEKCEKIGYISKLNSTDNWIKREHLQAARSIFINHGIEVV